MFEPGDRVTWLNRQGQRFTGVVVAVVPPDTHPLAMGWHWREKAAPYTVKFDLELPFTRQSESYLVAVPAATPKGKPQLWWPRVTTLQPPPRERTLFDADVQNQLVQF